MYDISVNKTFRMFLSPPPSLLTQPSEAAWCIPLYLCTVFGLIILDCGDLGSLKVSPVRARQHALIWMFLFYCVFVCLFVCVCILCSVVYQDGFYGADIYVSIIYWYDIACYIICGFCPVATHMQNNTNKYKKTLQNIQRETTAETHNATEWWSDDIFRMRDAPIDRSPIESGRYSLSTDRSVLSKHADRESRSHDVKYMTLFSVRGKTSSPKWLHRSGIIWRCPKKTVK